MQDPALEKIKQFYNKRNRLPNYKEMQKLFNNPPCTAVAYSVYKWKSAGLIENEGNKYKPTSKFFGLPLLGNIKAGYPTAEEGYEQHLKLHDYLIDNPESSYFLQIENGEMLEAGIHAGDVVIVDKSKQAKVGDIVATRFGNEWILDQYPPKVNYADLQPAVVVSVIRKYDTTRNFSAMVTGAR